MTTIQREESDRSADAALYAARARVIKAVPGIIDAVIQKAKDEGSYQHAKLLLEFAGSGGAQTNACGDESLAAMLIKELRDE